MKGVLLNFVQTETNSACLSEKKQSIKQASYFLLYQYMALFPSWPLNSSWPPLPLFHTITASQSSAIFVRFSLTNIFIFKQQPTARGICWWFLVTWPSLPTLSGLNIMQLRHKQQLQLRLLEATRILFYIFTVTVCPLGRAQD